MRRRQEITQRLVLCFKRKRLLRSFHRVSLCFMAAPSIGAVRGTAIHATPRFTRRWGADRYYC
ncbi:hypothetical protein BHJ80_18330 [Escherichia coli]|nr:hypothetical protein BHJ80_18330 [Escherichia coli]